jgi:L-threonylcarbamoyladenylate synthase
VKAALEALSQGRVVAVATESLFGLLADARRADALERLFSLKPRSAAVALVLPHRDAWRALVSDIPEEAEQLADAFWPGPLTIVLPARAAVDRRLTQGGTIGVRLPGPCPAERLVREFGAALTATSANRHGEPAALNDGDVEAYFPEAVARGDLVIVRGSASGGPPSTLVAVEQGVVSVVRAGAIAERDVLAVIRRAL